MEKPVYESLLVQIFSDNTPLYTSVILEMLTGVELLPTEVSVCSIAKLTGASTVLP